MPHMTAAYGFEWKVLEFTKKLSTLLTGADRALLEILDHRAAVHTMEFKHSDLTFSELRHRLESVSEAWIFYDPFDAPEHTWLSWHDIEEFTMERLIGQSFEPSDFRKGEGHLRAPDLDPASRFPTSSEVMLWITVILRHPVRTIGRGSGPPNLHFNFEAWI